MNVMFWLVTYNELGGHALLQDVCDFLLLGAPPSLGSAVTRFEIYANIDKSGRPLRNLGGMAERYRAHLEKLPRVTFLRRNRRFDISYITQLGSKQDLNRQRSLADSLKLFSAACREIAEVMQFCRRRLKESDDFDGAAFVAHLNKQLDRLPANQDAFYQVLKELADARTRRSSEGDAVAQPSARALRNRPKLITIKHDDHHARHVGRTADGAQFFLTTPFVPAAPGEPGREFIALYLFDENGRFEKARIDDLGPRDTLNMEHAKRQLEQRLAQVGPVKFGPIRVEPFQVERFGTVFGLVPELLEDEQDRWCVEARPGNYMAFYSPWHSGDYDT